MADINWSGGGGNPYSLTTGGASGYPGQPGGGFPGGLDLNSILQFAMSRARMKDAMAKQAYEDQRQRQLRQDDWASQDRSQQMHDRAFPKSEEIADFGTPAGDKAGFSGMGYTAWTPGMNVGGGQGPVAIGHHYANSAKGPANSAFQTDIGPSANENEELRASEASGKRYGSSYGPGYNQNTKRLFNPSIGG